LGGAKGGEKPPNDLAEFVSETTKKKREGKEKERDFSGTGGEKKAVVSTSITRKKRERGKKKKSLVW